MIKKEANLMRLREAYLKMREAAFQCHSAHFDKTGGSGSGCPGCLRIMELRNQAEELYEGQCEDMQDG